MEMTIAQVAEDEVIEPFRTDEGMRIFKELGKLHWRDNRIGHDGMGAAPCHHLKRTCR